MGTGTAASGRHSEPRAICGRVAQFAAGSVFPAVCGAAGNGRHLRRTGYLRRTANQGRLEPDYSSPLAIDPARAVRKVTLRFAPPTLGNL